MNWAEKLARQLSKHTDSLAVIRAGRKAKRRTRRRERQAARVQLRWEKHGRS